MSKISYKMRHILFGLKMSRKKGFLAEQQAKEFLLQRGFEIVMQNFFSRYGEIDIIALRDEVLHFIEVKSAKNTHPIYAVTPKKIHRILKTIDYFLLQNSIDRAYCFDVICVQDHGIEFLENIIL